MQTTLEFTVQGMHCGSCALFIDDALADLPGVITSRTSLKQGRATVTVDTTRTTPTEIAATIQALGYEPALSPDSDPPIP